MDLVSLRFARDKANQKGYGYVIHAQVLEWATFNVAKYYPFSDLGEMEIGIYQGLLMKWIVDIIEIK